MFGIGFSHSKLSFMKYGFLILLSLFSLSDLTATNELDSLLIELEQMMAQQKTFELAKAYADSLVPLLKPEAGHVIT